MSDFSDLNGRWFPSPILDGSGWGIVTGNGDIIVGANNNLTKRNAERICAAVNEASEKNSSLRSKAFIISGLAQAIQQRPEAGAVIEHKAKTILRTVDELAEVMGWPAIARGIESEIAATASSRGPIDSASSIPK